MTNSWIAIDVGGTFVDIVVWDGQTARLREAKVLRAEFTVPGRLREVTRSLLPAATAPDLIVGTTVITNAILEGKFDRTALVTTRGFADTLMIGRMRRASSYDLRARRPDPIVPADLAFECDERVDAKGVIKSPDEAHLRELAAAVAAADVDSVAVCLLHSFRDSRHEELVRNALAAHGIDRVTLSSEILPIYGEFERMSTTALNAATRRTMARFMTQLKDSLGDTPASLLIMSSSGGALETRDAEEVPARTVLSGPVGGVVGSAALATAHGYANAITLDIGGTSADVSFIEDGRLFTSEDLYVGGYPVAFPSVDIHTIGAGGGSIAQVNATGLLEVGPQSAGAEPGPICYSRGGTLPTVTDCWAVLGYLDPQTMLDGDFPLDIEAARRGVVAEIARPLGITEHEAANGVLRIVDRNVANAIRRISVEKGRDPGGAVLVAFGGAGPMHATAVARELRIPDVLIPPTPGVFSAMGMLMSDRGMEAHRTVGLPFTPAMLPTLAADAEALRADLGKKSEEYYGADTPVGYTFSFDIRYVGQGRTLTVETDDVSEQDLSGLAQAFAGEHERRYRYVDPEGDIEVVNIHCHLRTRGPRDDVEVTAGATTGGNSAQSHGTRAVYLSNGAHVTVPLYKRSGLPVESTVAGPAIIEQYDSVIILQPGDVARIKTDMSMVVSIDALENQEVKRDES